MWMDFYDVFSWKRNSLYAMVYYSKQYSMIKIDRRVSNALPILWRLQCRPG